MGKGHKVTLIELFCILSSVYGQKNKSLLIAMATLIVVSYLKADFI